MKIKKFSKKPSNFEGRIGAKPVVCYPNTNLKDNNLEVLLKARKFLVKDNEIIISPRDAKTFEVKSGNFSELKV